MLIWPAAGFVDTRIGLAQHEDGLMAGHGADHPVLHWLRVRLKLHGPAYQRL